MFEIKELKVHSLNIENIVKNANDLGATIPELAQAIKNEVVDSNFFVGNGGSHVFVHHNGDRVALIVLNMKN